MMFSFHLRPYPLESTGTHPNSEVKSMRAHSSTEMRDLSGTMGAAVFIFTIFKGISGMFIK